jgi:hypothetical protein
LWGRGLDRYFLNTPGQQKRRRRQKQFSQIPHIELMRQLREPTR